MKTIETQNINDLFVCEKCGRFGYYKFYSHSTRIDKNDYCKGRVLKFKNWIIKIFKEYEKDLQIIEKEDKK